MNHNANPNPINSIFSHFQTEKQYLVAHERKMPQSHLHKHLTREYNTWFGASAQPAPVASIFVQPGSERGFCERAAPRRTCLWDKRLPVWFPGPQPAAGLQRYSERCSAGLKEHRAVWITSTEDGLFASLLFYTWQWILSLLTLTRLTPGDWASLLDSDQTPKYYIDRHKHTHTYTHHTQL